MGCPQKENMPLLDTNGKRLSGQAQRKRAKAQKEQMQQEEELRRLAPKTKGLSFDDIPPPPLEKSEEALIWWNQVLVICASLVAHDQIMSLQKKLKYLHDGAGKAGMIRDKVKDQEDIKRYMQKEEMKEAKNEKEELPLTEKISFQNLAAPNLDSVDEGVSWWNQTLLVCAELIIRDKKMPLEQKIKYLLDGAGRAGMIRDKEKEKIQIGKILDKEDRAKTPGLQDVSQFKAPLIILRPER